MGNFKTWKQDIQASLVVFLVALPLCLGIALASGAPLAAGLFAGIIGGVVVGYFSGSPISVSGPAAGLTVIVASAIQDLGSFQAFTLAVFIAGFLQILLGAFKAGEVGNYFPTSVIKGMLAAIGIILMLKQFPHAVGYDVDYMGNEAFEQGGGENTFSGILRAFESLHPTAVLLTLSSFAIMLTWEKAAKRWGGVFTVIPGALMAVLFGIVCHGLTADLPPGLALERNHLVQLPFEGGWGDLAAGFRLPDWSMVGASKVWVTAFTLAVVASLESLLSVDAADKIQSGGNVTSKNRELLAQGLGNALSGLVGGLPVTAVIIRTSANVTAGAKSKLSTVMHGFWLLLCVVFLPDLLNRIPLSTLAAVLMLVGYKLTKPAIFKALWQKGHNQFIPFVVTIVAILLTDLLIGILIGMGVGFAFVIRSSLHQSMTMVSDGDLYLLRFHKDVSFLQKSALIKVLDRVPPNSSVIIDGSRSVFVDEDIVALIEDFVDRARAVGTTVELKKSTMALSPFFREQTHG